MSVQVARNNTTVPFLRSGKSFFNDNATIKQDAGRAAVLAKFTLMGKSEATIPATGTADGGNTGDGTVTAVAFTAGGTAREGTWELEVVTAIANGSIFKLTDPDGNIVESNLTMTVGAGAATIFTAGGMIFTITDGATDFAAADKFTIAVTADGDFVPFLPGNVDGGQKVKGIFMGDEITVAALQAGDVVSQPIIVGGCFTFDSAQLVFDDGTSDLDMVLSNGNTVRYELSLIGAFSEATIDIDSFENA